MSKIASLTIDADTNGLPDYMIGERDRAVAELIGRGQFQPLDNNTGPYDVRLSVEDARLAIRMKDSGGIDLTTHVLSLSPYRRIIADYFMMIESYEAAKHGAMCGKLEAIDMGRRGVHNEGAELLQSRLADKIELDHETARKFFTLICVLHHGHARLVA
jgi:uncharacterized protein (UPF0262 family)